MECPKPISFDFLSLYFDLLLSLHVKWPVFKQSGDDNSFCDVFEFFLSVFSEFTKFSGKKIIIFLKDYSNLPPVCKITRCYHRTSKTLVAHRILKFSPILASVIYEIS